MKPTALFLSALLVSAASPLAADGPSTTDITWRSPAKALQHSQIMKTMHMLTDVYGPRLTGSPNLKQAGEWAAKQMTSWGLVNAHLEPWDFGHPGWLNERLAVHVTSPVKDSLVGEVLAWTPSTRGVVHAAAMQLTPPERPTADALKTYLYGIGDTVSGRIVLMGAPRVVPVDTQPSAKRLSDTEARSRFDPVNPAPSPFANFTPPTPTPGVLTAAQVNEQLDQFLVDHHAAVRVNDAGREHGQIRAFNNRTFDVAKAVPTVMLRNEDYGRISRLLADKLTVSNLTWRS